MNSKEKKMKKKTYIQPEIAIEIIDTDSLLETISKTDNGAGNGDNEDDYAKKGHGGFFFDDDTDDWSNE